MRSDKNKTKKLYIIWQTETKTTIYDQRKSIFEQLFD